MICKAIPSVDSKGHQETQVWFWCPGCDEAHAVVVSNDSNTHPIWTWNGNDVLPTFSPSIRCRSDKVCHSFVTDGKIRFLSDSTHALSGQTVALPELPDWLAD